MTVEWLAAFAAACRSELDGWEPAVVDLGGGLGVRHVPDEEAPTVEEFVGELLRRLERGWELHGLRRPLVVLEPGRSLVGRAGVALYRVGAVKRRARRRPTWPSTAGCPTTRARSSTARATRR